MKPNTITYTLLVGLLMPFFVATEAKSQTKIGLRLGLNASRVTGNAVSENLKTGIGYNVGLFARLNFDGIDFQPELVASGRSYTFAQSLNVNGDLKVSEKKVKASYLDIPLLIRVELSEQMNMVAGPQFSINMGNKQTIVGGDSLGTGFAFRWYEVGLTGGLQYVFKNEIDLTLRGVLGVTPIFEKTNATLAGDERPAIKTLMFQFTVGLPISTAPVDEPDRSSYKTIY